MTTIQRPSATTTSPVTGPTQTVPRVAWVRRQFEQRFNGIPSWVVITQLFIGLGWIRAATEKAIDVTWWRGEVLWDFVLRQAPGSLGWYWPFLEAVVVPNVVWISLLVMLLQIGIGVSLLRGRYLAAGLGVGMFLNLNFLAAGAVNPSAFYLLSQGALALWLAEQRGTVRTVRRLRQVSIGAVVLAVISVPFISTMQPHQVIEDPAIMLVTGGVLTVLGCVLAHRTIVARRGPDTPAA